MKKNRVSYRSIIAFIAIISTAACVISWIKPTATVAAKSNVAAEPAQKTDPVVIASEDVQLVQLLEKDGLIDEVKGFIVEKAEHSLFIDGLKQPASIADKYIATLQKKNIRVQVYPFAERLRQHPNADLLQVILPVLLSSPCVDTKPPPKVGC